MNKQNKIKKIALLLILTLVFCSSCTVPVSANDEVENEMESCFNFFYNVVNDTENSPAYGIIADRWPEQSAVYGSIASVGFGLTAMIIGVEKGYITYAQGEERVLGTLQTLVNLQDDSDSAYEGFFYHFLSMTDGKKYGNCEVSTIDTAIMLCGALSCGEYFGGEIEKLANTLYANVNWRAFIIKRAGKSYISMAYSNGVVSSGCWDYYAEQLMIYVLGAGSPTEAYRLTDEEYYDFTRKKGSYGGYSFIYSYFGSIFTYQYSHAWIDFRDYVDNEGINWYDNSVNASKAAYQYCVDNSSVYETYSKKSWGLTACDVPGGYSGYLGALPRGWSSDAAYSEIAGTIAPAGALGSVVFTPNESLTALVNYYKIDGLTSRYGLLDSYNLDRNWTASNVIGIDKGITLLMLANYQDETVWDIFMQNDYVLNGLEVLGLEKQ